jgi:hypothetical protein
VLSVNQTVAWVAHVARQEIFVEVFRRTTKEGDPPLDMIAVDGALSARIIDVGTSRTYASPTS